MNDDQLAVQTLHTYKAARAVIAPILSSVELFGLLRGAFESGMLAVARTPSSPAHIAAAINMDQTRVIEFCTALDAHGIFVKEDENYRLADQWMTLTAPEALYSFQLLLDGTFARAKVLQFAAKDITDFWMLTADERLALAKGSSVDPASPNSAPLLKSLLQENLPDLHAVLTAGGKYLELGCGVAGGLLSLLRAYPNVTAIGVEIAADLVEEANRRAVTLGVHDRVVFWQGDAQDFDQREAFDYVFWSQFFFPSATRSRALQVALHALKPGGILIAPVQGDSSVVNEHLHTEAGQAYTRSRLIFGSWGISAQSRQELQQEIEGAGFINSRPTALFNPVITAQRPFTDH